MGMEKYCLFVVVLLISIPCRTAMAQVLDRAKLDELFSSLDQRNEAMGSLTLLKNGKVIYSTAIGYRYISENEKLQADTNTRYRIASITKTFTATLIFQLIEEGKLNLETLLEPCYFLIRISCIPFLPTLLFL